jgi:two-component SAPR family response regulator
MIHKYFAHSKYSFKNTHLRNPENDILEDLGYTPDCIIIDSEINSDLRNKISSTYSNTKIIYLPSLSGIESDSTENKDIIKVSEPLKLHELEEVINKIFS